MDRISSIKNEDGVIATINALMEAGVTGDLSGLDKIYHDDMLIIMIDPEGQPNKLALSR